MCGIVGVVNESREAGPDIFFACTEMQHRGKESGGIAVFDEEAGYMDKHIGMGDMAQVFMGKSAASLRGKIGIGHVRYSNTGSSSLKNAQPVIGFFRGKEFACGHNGNLVNTKALMNECSMVNRFFDSDCSDTRVVAGMISQSRAASFKEALLEVLPKLEGAFCFLFLCDGNLYAARDPYGFHPFQLGRRGRDCILASESMVFDHLSIESPSRVERSAEFERDISPGELFIAGRSGEYSMMWSEPKNLKFDIFEYIYFLRPDSKVYGVRVELARRMMGRYLAEEQPAEADIIVPVRSSGSAASRGYAERMREMGYLCKEEPEGLFRPNVVGRVWVEPFQEIREEYLRLKFNIIPELIDGRDVIVVDDSIVRGNTIKRIVKLMRQGGARKVHVRISCPPYMWPDIYGNDTYKDYQNDRLVALTLMGDAAAIAKSIGVDSLGYLSLEKTKRAILAVKEPGSILDMDSFYDGVFTKKYPAGTGDYIIR